MARDFRDFILIFFTLNLNITAMKTQGQTRSRLPRLLIALRNGAKVELISKILGHSSVGITLDVYRIVTQGEIKAEHARFGLMGEKALII